MTPKSPDKRIAFFAGSFHPFTKGHASIVTRALEMFGGVTIAVGINASKPDDALSATARCAAIAALYAHEPRVSVMTYSGLTADAAVSAGACCLLRGVRSVKDFEYERDMADVNRSLCGLDTVLLYSLPEYAALSSSIVRELQSLGRDVSAYLPNPDEL